MTDDVAGIILAAGQSNRMGERNKLCELWHGKPLVRHVYDAAVMSRLNGLCVVTGHKKDKVCAALPADATIVHNRDFASGMASSLRTGLAAAKTYRGAIILLGDMPLVTTGNIDAMIELFEAGSRRSIIVATSNGQPGNPVLIGSDHVDALCDTSKHNLTGDRGARAYVSQHADDTINIEIGAAAGQDFDTPGSFQI